MMVKILTNLNMPNRTTKVPFKKVAIPIKRAIPAKMKGNSSFKLYCCSNIN